MVKAGNQQYLELPAGAEAALIAAARDANPVRGLTHGFYKYPARFSPVFVRAVIEAFTRRGDFCLDPHVGGGTTLVEALALGRHAVGVDVSTLAEFVSVAKTTIFSDADFIRLENWAARIPYVIDIRKPSVEIASYAELGYYKHLVHPTRWRIRKAIEQAIGSAIRLRNEKQETFARCATLRTAQWALDGRKSLPSLEEFRNFLAHTTSAMLKGAKELRDVTLKNGATTPKIEVINRSAAGLETDARLANRKAPRLVLTSPPYPGVHVLYHRWQVDGRKEAPLPFMIANKLDGAGGSYYTMGDRKHAGLKTYFDNIRATMSSVAALADEYTTIVQMVAFAEPDWQLPQFLETLKQAGLAELLLPALEGEGDGRLWRSVPGRRWYSDQRGETPGSKEVVLLHRKASISATGKLDQALSRRGLAFLASH